MRVTIIVEDNPATLAEKINFFVKELTYDQLIDIKFTTDFTDNGSWYNAMIIYDKK